MSLSEGLYGMVVIRAVYALAYCSPMGRCIRHMSERQTHICTSPARLRCTGSPVPSGSSEPAFCHFERWGKKQRQKEREREKERHKSAILHKSAIFQFWKINPSETAAFSWQSSTTRSDAGGVLPGGEISTGQSSTVKVGGTTRNKS